MKAKYGGIKSQGMLNDYDSFLDLKPSKLKNALSELLFIGFSGVSWLHEGS